MILLLRWVTARHLSREIGSTALAIAGVALGVAVFVAIRLANASALASFRSTVDSVAGTANLQVSAEGGGIDERLFPRVRRIPGVLAAAPVVQALAPVAEQEIARGTSGDATGEILLVLGIDLFSEIDFDRYPITPEEVGGTVEVGTPTPGSEVVPPGGPTWSGREFLSDPMACAITASLARRLGMRLGSSLPLLAGTRRVDVTVRAILAGTLEQAMGGSVALLDIATAQEFFGRQGRLDRIDLRVTESERDRVMAALRGIFPPGVQIGRPEGRTQQVENMLRAFQLNLTALSCIALFVAAFLILNAISMSVVRRRRETGILRSLGVTRRQTEALFLLEAAIVGAIGSAAGLAIGVLLARTTLGSISETISALYIAVQARTVVVTPGVLWQGAALGLLGSLLAALAPAREAATTPPGTTMRQGPLIERHAVPLGAWSALGGMMLLGSLLTAIVTLRWGQPLLGFGSALLLMTGCSLLTPACIVALERLLAPPVRAVFGITGILGSRYLVESLARTAAITAALMVAVSMLVGLTIMIASFRDTVDTWVTQTVRADLYVEPAGRTIRGSSATIPEEIVRLARSLPGVAAVDTYRGFPIVYRGRRVGLVGIDFRVLARHGRLLLKEGRSADAARRALATDGALVTESFARRTGTQRGDRLTIDTPTGRHTAQVHGIFYDYSTDAGAILVDQALLTRWWGHRIVQSMALYLSPRPGYPAAPGSCRGRRTDLLAPGVGRVGTPTPGSLVVGRVGTPTPGTLGEEVRRKLLAATRGRHALIVTPNESLRRHVLEVFDQTFRITDALQAIVVIVAALGVVNTLTALILQRGREIGILRAVGAHAGQIRQIVLVEAGLIGLFAWAIGALCGLALAIMLVTVINQQFFGWTIRLRLEPGVFLQTLALMLVTALLAGLFPARAGARRVPAEAMRIE